ncbi:MAG: hypothetical protein IIA34_00005 [Proteobacteria bacterium]|nr:hypothetical protein [Pseudomonadota bacterium]
MAWLISTSLRFRVLVIALAVALIVVGLRTADDIPLEHLPTLAHNAMGLYRCNVESGERARGDPTQINCLIIVARSVQRMLAIERNA